MIPLDRGDCKLIWPVQAGDQGDGDSGAADRGDGSGIWNTWFPHFAQDVSFGYGEEGKVMEHFARKWEETSYGIFCGPSGCGANPPS